MSKSAFIATLFFWGFFIYADVHQIIRITYIPIDGVISQSRKLCKDHVPVKDCDKSSYSLRNDKFGREYLRGYYMKQWLPSGTMIKKKKWSNKYYINGKEATLGYELVHSGPFIFIMIATTSFVYLISNRKKR